MENKEDVMKQPVTIYGELENQECKEIIKPYINILLKKVSETVCVIEEDSVKVSDRIFKNKKLLPLSGNSVNVIEYEEQIVVVTLEMKFIIALYKNRFQSK